jgi:hypothetical protein
MEDIVVIHVTSVKESVSRMDSRILLRLERAFIDKFLPHSVVGREIDVLEKLSIEHRIDSAGRLLRAYINAYLLLRECID